MRRHPLKKLLAGALGLIVLGCVWFYFAPSTLGGSTNYVVTHGISMEPLFHTGDLAIVRSQPSYHIGEIVAYHNKMLHVIALHRIIGREGNRYIFKGDNNDFIDPEHPRASQLIGALWIHIHGGGRFLQSFSSPARAGLLIALGMLLLMGGVFARKRRRRRRERRAEHSVPRAPRTLPLGPGEPVAAVMVIGTVALLPFVLLALLAFSRAPATRRAVQIPYKQSGKLSYSADVAPNAVYPEGVARTGEPLFTQLVNDINLRFDYKFAAKARHSLTSKGSFQLLLSASDGWHRTLQLGSPTYFKGNHATITGTLSLNSLLALAHSIEITTHVDSGYAFAIVPTVITSGSVEGVPVHATFAPAVQFSVNSDEVSLQAGASRSSLLTAGTTSGATGQLTPSATGAAAGEQSQPRSLTLGPWRVSVSTARTLALSAIGVILAVVLAALALIGPLIALIAPRRDEAASILARYRGLIIPVAHIAPLRGVPVIDVADMDALARIAEHYDRSILHETTAAGNAFWVADESGQFRYTIGEAPPIGDDTNATSVPSTNGQIATPASPVAATNGDEPTLVHATTPERPTAAAVAAPSLAATGDVPAPAELETGNAPAVPAAHDDYAPAQPSPANGHTQAPAWSGDHAMPTTGVLDDIATPAPTRADANPVPAAEVFANGAVPAATWSDTNPMPATAAFDTTPAPEPTGASPIPAADPSQGDRIRTPEWSDSGQVSAPAWGPDANGATVDDHAAELLASTVYVGELEHPGPFAAPQWQPLPEHAAVASSTDSGWVALPDQAWGADADTLVREGASWRPPSPVDADLAPTGAAAASFTGLEWTTNS
jgi:signal peptidase I